jgi:hypothetical protein
VSDVRTNGRAPDGRVEIDSYTPPPGPILGDGQGEYFAWLGLGVAVGALGLVGFVVSFSRVQEGVVPYFGGLAWTVPLGIDLGIAVFTGLDLLMTYSGMRTRWLRLVPWSLVTATVYLNTVGEPTTQGKVAHAVLPLLWVIAVEAGAHVVRHRAGLAGKGDQMDRVRGSRWILAPMSTATMRRRMILTEETSYPSAITRDLDSRVVKARWRDEYGFWWRLRVPREQRVLYRHGRLTPTGVVFEVPAQLPASPQEAPALGPAAPQPPALKSGPRRTRQAASSPEDVEKAVRHLVADEFDGKVPGRPTLRPRLKALGLTIGNDDLAALIQKIRADTKEDTDAG